MPHTWKFFRAGGFDQVRLTTGADLVALGELDQKLWVALACPVEGLEFDRRTLELIDTDRDGRVRATELIAATRWAGSMLKDVESLAAGSSSLPLTAIADQTDDAKLVLQTAKALLKSLKKENATAIDVEDTKHALSAFAAEAFNGDGIVPPDAASDPEVHQALLDVIACATFPQVDKSGKTGVGEASLIAFVAEIAAHAAWLDAGLTVRPLGDATESGYAAFSAMKPKIDDWFARCRVAAFDSRAIDAVNREQSEYLALAAKDLHVTAAEIAHFPIAKVAPGTALSLVDGVNPAWSEPMAAFRAAVVAPIVGDRTSITEADWTAIRAKFTAYEAWLATRAGGSVEKLGPARVRALATSGIEAKIRALIAQDTAAAPMATAIESVERLVRYHRDLMSLANNFVAFRDFYGRRSPATFQAGTLYLDQRACELCIRVNDAGKHATMAPLAKSYLLYCDLRNAKGEKMSIAAAVTNGDIDNLMVGRNGVFYDRQGQDWDATVTKIVDNPISVRQAFWSPYKKFLRLIEEMIAKRAADAEAAADAKVTSAAVTVDSAVSGAPPAAPPSMFDVGTVAALGVAVGGITAAMGALLQAFFGLGLWMPLGVVGIIGLISGPSMAVAWLKLRQRNLGPLLDANGWAVNAQAKLNVPLGASLTKVAVLPPGSSRDLTDPFAERSRPWGVYLAVVIVLGLALGWYIGKLDAYLPAPAKSTSVMGAYAPAAQLAAQPAAPSEVPPAPAP